MRAKDFTCHELQLFGKAPCEFDASAVFTQYSNIITSTTFILRPVSPQLGLSEQGASQVMSEEAASIMKSFTG